MSKQHIGSTLDSLFVELGELEEVQLLTVKRVLAADILHRMAETEVTKAKLARLMKTSRSAVDRLLDPDDTGVTLATIARAASALSLTLVRLQFAELGGAVADRFRIACDILAEGGSSAGQYAQASGLKVRIADQPSEPCLDEMDDHRPQRRRTAPTAAASAVAAA